MYTGGKTDGQQTDDKENDDKILWPSATVTCWYTWYDVDGK